MRAAAARGTSSSFRPGVPAPLSTRSCTGWASACGSATVSATASPRTLIVPNRTGVTARTPDAPATASTAAGLNPLKPVAARA